MNEKSKTYPVEAGPEHVDLKQKVEDERSAYALSLSQIAREIGPGVSQSTLSDWLSGKYRGDVEAVEMKIARWLGTRRERERRSLQALGIDRHQELGVTDEIAAVLAYAQSLGDIVLVHGPSGAGKSWAARRYCETRSVAYLVTATGAVTTNAGLLNRVAECVGLSSRQSSAQAAERAIIERLSGRGAILIVDEAHHLSTRLVDELRCIRDIAQCGLGLVGSDEIWTSITSSRRTAQIIGRIGNRLALGPMPEADALAWAQTLLGRAPSRHEVEIITRSVRSAGGMHTLRRLFSRAWLSARADEREKITGSDIEIAASVGEVAA